MDIKQLILGLEKEVLYSLKLKQVLQRSLRGLGHGRLWSSCSRIVLMGCASIGWVASTSAQVQYQQMRIGQHVLEVVKIDQPGDLHLYLNDQNNKNIGSFNALQKHLGQCQQLGFAMNAGMYHPNYQPVGLYVENGKQKKALNTAQGSGNFFMQPNGVLAWNQQKAVIQTTQDYQKTGFKASYATQSGPMLVINGKINTAFKPTSDSYKIRNGVGIKGQSLYFVISRSRINFYDFAQFFQKQLQVENALYLDGTISSLYYPGKSHDRLFQLGPMVAISLPVVCR